VVYSPKIIETILLFSLIPRINFDSIVERAMQVCLKDFQDNATPPRVKMYLLVNFDFLEFTIQFASLYPSSTSGYFSYLKTYSLVLDTQPTTRNKAVQ